MMSNNDTVNTYIPLAISTESIEDGVDDNPGSPLVQIATHSFVEDSSSHSSASNPDHTEGDSNGSFAGTSVLQDKEVNAYEATKENTNPQRCLSREDDVPSFSSRNKIQRNASLINHDALCSKVLVIVGVVIVIGCYILPIIVFIVTQTRSNTETDLEFSHENISDPNANLTRVCNFLGSSLQESECTEEILYTYEALRTINFPPSQQYCSERVESLFCDALMECSNVSYVREIVCQQVRQEYCTAEWRILEVLNQTDGLIDCEEYEETAPLNCGDQFGLTNDGSACLPLCKEFSQYSEAYTRPYVIVTASASIVNIIGGVIVIAISFKKRKMMFRFPQVLVVLNAGDQIVIHCLELTTTLSVGRWNVLCSSRFLTDAYDNPTAFCAVQGTLITSAVYAYASFWLLYMLDLALKVFYPLKADKLIKCEYKKIIYIAEVLIVFLIGTVPPIIFAARSNYRVNGFPPVYCGIHPTYQFYALAIPVLIINSVCEAIMILVLYKLHKHYGIFKKEHRESVGKQVYTCQFTVPEVKIVFVLLYWVLCNVIIWTFLAIGTGRYDIINNILDRLFICMAGGNREGHNCDVLRQELEAESVPGLEVTFLISIAFLNFVSLPFVIEFQSIKKSVRKAAKKLNISIASK